MTLTKRQKEIFDFIEQTINEQGYAPTLEEIGERFRLRSLATVHKHVSNLEAKGLIRRKWNHSRAIEIVNKRKRVRAVELPLLGVVAAGQPIERSKVTTPSKSRRASCGAAIRTCFGCAAIR